MATDRHPQGAPAQAATGASGGDLGSPPLLIATEVVHQLPGRLRMRVPLLRRRDLVAARVVDFLRQQPGVQTARVNPACAALVVIYDPTLVTPRQIEGWLARAVTLPSAASPRAMPRPRVWALLCGAVASGLALGSGPPGLALGFLAGATLPIVARAIQGLISARQIGVDVLDATAIGLLVAQGDLVTPAVMAFLIAAGEYIRSLTARRSRLAVSQLLGTTGRLAWVVRGPTKERVAIEALVVGDTVVVYPGDLIPVDGVVCDGRALVDQRVLTGESTPILAEPGATVFAASFLLDGKLYIRAARVGAATRVAQIVSLLDRAPVHDTRIADYARRIGDRLVLPTLLLAGGVSLVTGDLRRVAAVVTFDLATGIRVSTPTTVLAAMTAASRRGILIKGGRALEQLARIDTLLFDKTGTLTIGAPTVTAVHALDADICPDTVLALAAAVEARFSHPAADAIVRAARARQLTIPERGASQYTLGQGIEAVIDGGPVLVGSVRYLAARGISLPSEARRAAEEAGRGGATTVFVAQAGRLLGWITYADTLRPEAAAVVAKLRQRGIGELLIVTGDHPSVARVVAGQVGIGRFVANAPPEQKAAIVRRLQARGYAVGVIGDGINDSPALAHADVSISLAAGTDVARETADVVLHGNLHGLPDAIDLARATQRLIYQNLGIVAGANGGGIILATAGVIGPLAAALLNNGSTIVAALNALRPLLPPSLHSTLSLSSCTRPRAVTGRGEERDSPADGALADGITLPVHG